MFDKIKDFVRPYSNEIAKHSPWLLIIFGVVFLFFGIVGEPWLIKHSAPNRLPQWLTSIGTAILGAGVFAVFLKSSQFSLVFQKHISDVIYADKFGDTVKGYLAEVAYSPHSALTANHLEQHWSILTKSMLHRTLRTAHDDAARAIMNQFLSADHDYHYRLYERTYNISIAENGNDVIIEEDSTVDLLMAPSREDPALVQRFSVDGEFSLSSLKIAGNSLSVPDFLTQCPGKKDIWELRVPLNRYISKDSSSTQSTIRVHRHYKSTQKLRTEPYILAVFRKYTERVTVHARVQSGYHLVMSGIGLDGGLSMNMPPRRTDHEGYSCWNLSKNNNFILPGQGYILIIQPDGITSASD